MTTSIRIVRHTQRFDAVRTFYQNGLDMRPIAEWDRGEDDRGVLLVFKGPTSATSIEVLTHPGAARRSVADGAESAVTVSAEVDNVGALYEEFESRDVQIPSDIATMPWGHRSFSVRDPDGFEISFFQDMNQRGD